MTSYAGQDRTRRLVEEIRRQRGRLTRHELAAHLNIPYAHVADLVKRYELLAKHDPHGGRPLARPQREPMPAALHAAKHELADLIEAHRTEAPAPLYKPGNLEW